MPFNTLAEPAILQSLTHLKANDLVPKLHQVVKHRLILCLQLPIKEVTLDNMSGRLPLLMLPKELAFLYLSTHCVSNTGYSTIS